MYLKDYVLYLDSFSLNSNCQNIIRVNLLDNLLHQLQLILSSYLPIYLAKLINIPIVLTISVYYIITTQLQFIGYNIILLKCKGYYCGYLRLPLGQPLDTPQTSISYILKAYAHSIQFPQSLRPYLLKDSSLLPIYSLP